MRSDTVMRNLFHNSCVVEMGSSEIKLGDNYIQNFHLGRYIVGCTVICASP